jgi:hypothetical protein
MEYGGGRTKDTIVSWILKKSGPPSAAVSCAGLADKLNDSKFVVAFFGDETDPLFTEAHLPYATSEDNIAFVHAGADCATEHEALLPVSCSSEPSKSPRLPTPVLLTKNP